MTFIRRLQKGNHTYLYNVRTYRDKQTGKVKQESEYLGKEVVEDGTKTIKPPSRKRCGLREILEYGPHMALLKVSEEFGLPRLLDRSIGPHTSIADIGTKIVLLAIQKICSDLSINSVGHWFSRSSLKTRLELTPDDFTPKKTRGILELLATGNPDISGIIEEEIAEQIKELYGEDLSTAVYDLTALTYHGENNQLAQYGHAYRTTGEKQINMVLAVTMKNKLPLHHKVLPGKIVSVSTIHSFVKELQVFGVKNAILIIDRGFYSIRNIKEILAAKHDIIGALSSHLKITKKALAKCGAIENSRNRLNYPGNVLFFKETTDENIRVIVYHDPKKRARQLEDFYEGLNDVENRLRELEKRSYPSKTDLEEELGGICGRYSKYITTQLKRTEEWTFTYNLKHKAIQRFTNNLGKTVLFTSTSLDASDVLKLYREKDVIEKAFQLMKKHGLTPLNSNTETATKARILLSYLGYLLLSLLRMKLNQETSLGKCLTILGEIREVRYKDGSSDLPELSKPQREVLEMVGLM